MGDSDRLELSTPPMLPQEHRTLRTILERVNASGSDLRGSLDAASEAVIAFDVKRRMLYANPRAAQLFGHGPGDLDGQSTDMLIPPRLRQPDAPPMNETTDVMQVELPGLMRDGSERLIEWCFASTRLGGQVVFVMTVKDRLELERAVARLRESEQRFQLFVSSVRDYAVYMLDAGGRVSSWNAGAARVKGWDAEDIIGQSYEVFFTPEDRDAGLPARLLDEAAREGSHKTKGWRVRKDGTRFWVEGSLTVLRDDDGQIRGFAKITRDLTERVQAEENERRLIAERAARAAAEEGERQIRASEERITRLQRVTAALSEAATPDDVAAAVLRECTGAANAAGGAVFVTSPDGRSLELVGQRGHPDDTSAAFLSLPMEASTPISDAGRQRTPLFLDSLAACVQAYPALRTAMQAGDFEASVALPLIAHGDLLGVLGVRFREPRTFTTGERAFLLTMSDLCAQALDRARLYAAECEARAAAESASRAKDEFLAMLGHELRNPLAPIATAVELMKLRGYDGAPREREIIERQVVHLNRLVDDLLDVSRVARGMVSLSRAPIAVADILSKAVEQARPLLEQRRQQLTVSGPAGALFVDADGVRMAQVVSNLLTNAAKYTPPGGHVWLSATREEGRAVIRVRDDGEGIGPDLLPRVFDLFVQGARSKARSEGGLGLGLAIVKSLVGLHGGTVGVASEGPGKGSEFIVRLDAVAAPQEVTSAAAGAESAAAPARASKRILLVDDNEDARELLADMLRAFGYDVELAEDGPTALGKLRTFPADVAILDLGLPVMDGFELARRITEAYPAPRPRLIALTGYGREGDVAQTRAVGFDVHLVKPVDVPVLVSAIDPDATELPDVSWS